MTEDAVGKSAHRLGDPNDADAVIEEVIQPDVFTNNLLASIDGCPVEEHGTGEHDSPVTANGSPTVFIHYIPANRTGDPDSCGHARAIGSPDVFIGDGVAEEARALEEKQPEVFRNPNQ